MTDGQLEDDIPRIPPEVFSGMQAFVDQHKRWAERLSRAFTPTMDTFNANIIAAAMQPFALQQERIAQQFSALVTNSVRTDWFTDLQATLQQQVVPADFSWLSGVSPTAPTSPAIASAADAIEAAGVTLEQLNVLAIAVAFLIVIMSTGGAGAGIAMGGGAGVATMLASLGTLLHHLVILRDLLAGE